MFFKAVVRSQAAEHRQAGRPRSSRRDSRNGSPLNGHTRGGRSQGRHGRRGVILLVVMVLLALMTLLCLTLVLVTAQGRLSALAAARNPVQSATNSNDLTTARTQIVAGSADPNSAFGAHGLLEDIYGLPQFFGQIAPNNGVVPSVLPIGETSTGAASVSGGNNGSLLQLLIVPGNINATGASGVGLQSANQYVLPYNSGAFCGQVITMLTGPAAGQSARVVGYYYNNFVGGQIASMQVSSFAGLVPNPGDSFMINGRPFSGTGFGLDLTRFQAPPSNPAGPWAAPYTQPGYAGTGPLLSAFESATSLTNPVASNMPYAYLPNHARIGLTSYLPNGAGTYWDPAGPGGANEPYDAPDFQNLMLAMHYWNSASGSVITPIPSLHRPELIAWYFAQAAANPAAFYSNPPLGNPADGAGGQNMLALRRKVILRPEPTDNYFNDLNSNGVWDAREPFIDVDGNGSYSAGDTFLDLNGDTFWTAGETDYSGHTFNPVTGAWFITAGGGWAVDTNAGLDVDNDGDGIPDSIWVEAGLPVNTETDGTLTKNLVAVLCIDLDGKVNINASGTLAQLDPFRYAYNPYSAGGYGIPPNPWNVNTPNVLSGPINALGSTFAYVPTGPATVDYNQRTVPVGQGYGAADINPLHLFVRSHGQAGALNYYQVFMQGFDGYPNAPSTVPPVDGKYGESTRLTLVGVPGFSYPGVYPPGSALPTPWGAAVGSPLTWTQFYLNGPRAGWSQWFDPYSTSLLSASGSPAYWVNDAMALARFSDIRPGLLTPPAYTNPFSPYPVPYYFDFFVGTVQPGGQGTGPATHLPTASGTPTDLHSRGFMTTDITGRPYYLGTATIPWEALPAVWSGTMTDAAITVDMGAYPFLQTEQLLNDGVDTAYELNLTPNARQVGQNTGNSLNNIPDFASIDNKFDPSELEGILRSHEWGVSGTANSSSLVSRLNSLETAAHYLATGTATPLTTQLGNDNVRLALTTESSDLPVPNISLTPQQMQDVVSYTNMLTLAGVRYPALPNLSSVSLTDLARARIYVENIPANINKGGLPPIFAYSGNTFDADLALFGNLKNTWPNVTFFPTIATNPTPGPFNPAIPVWPLLAPESILGMRLDVNRLLGNGVDDNGNGVVDEPAEVLWQWANATGAHGESMVYPFSQISSTSLGPTTQINPVTAMNNLYGALDLNNDGFVPGSNLLLGVPSSDPQTGTLLPADPTNADMRARQLLARHLYVTMMLLLDDRTFGNGTGNNATLPTAMLAQIFNSNAASLPAPWPQYATLTAREQAAYIIAQWAINVVDFRDRDSIMTPFEFDLYPFRADDATQFNSLNVNTNITWNVDDVVGPSSIDDSNPWGIRGLVWGCERPEILMTETLAVHDRGTADTSTAQNINNNVLQPPLVTTPATGADTVTTNTTATPVDVTFDQVRRPRGSLIVELLNVTNPSDAPQRDLQFDGLLAQNGLNPPWLQGDVNGNSGYGVNLAQVATGVPDVNSTGPLWSPVWRLVIAYSQQYSETNFYSGWAASPGGQSKTLDPRVPVLPATAIHRAVYFAPYQVGFITPGTSGASSLVNDVMLSRSFFLDSDLLSTYNSTLNDNIGPLMLPPSQYAIVAPACPDLNVNAGPTYKYKNYLGLNNNGSNLNVRQLQMGYAQPSATPSSLTIMTDGNGVPLMPPGIAPVIGVPIQTTWLDTTQTYVKHNNANILSGSNATNPYGQTGLTQTVASTLRMSVSEPEHGYPVYSSSGVGTGTGSMWDDDAYYKYGLPTTPTTIVGQFPQHPFDSGQINPQNSAPYLVAGDQPNTYVAPGGSTQSMTTGYTMVYLQRLANPLNHWDATANPYITVDSMPVDLTAYTGEWATAETGTTYYINGTPGGTSAFDTRRRGWIAASAGNNGVAVGAAEQVANVWTPLPVLPSGAIAAGQYGINAGQGTASLPFVSATLGYTNTEYGGGILPMPWIAWNNRPYISQYELMLVPQSSPSTLLQDFGMLGWSTSPEKQSASAAAINEYAPGAPANLPTASPYAVLPVAQFANLLNFFNTQQTAASNTQLPNLYRIFEMLQVPSRYTGTQDMLDPSQFAGNDAVLATAATTLNVNASHMFHTPFNWLPRYREPGKINLNTIFDPIVFQALMDDYPGTLFGSPSTDATIAFSPTCLWQYMSQSRQGFAVGGAPYPPNPVAQYLSAAGAYPTYFANPFRPDGSGAFVPPTVWSQVTPPVAPALPVAGAPFAQAWTYPAGGIYTGVNTTLLRPSPANSSLALFDDTAFDTTNLGATYMTSTNYPFRDAAVNAAFQYQMFTRLGNTTTNRSNVYAIWVTLGKFQVQSVAASPTNPDGYKLLQPYLDATGNQVVTRGFYIFDRSIPMGFQRGQDLNIEKGMLMERVLQVPQQ
ncbi:MAG TPA: hypothetical protein VHC22_15710 [Pirellulales bacterium]|nr:hypothetical protein [Pirellulales bacterium]